MKAARIALAFVATALAGCSGASGLTTGSIFGSSDPPKKEAINDPLMRAFQVGTVSARAIKCGFNFDPAKLKTNYLAYERQTPGVDVAKIERVYDVSFNGVAKAVASETDYCSTEKTRTIKADLGRHLAGDFSPSTAPKEPQEEGLLSGWGSGSSSGPGYKERHPMDNSDI
jgi:surface antigen